MSTTSAETRGTPYSATTGTGSIDLRKGGLEAFDDGASCSLHNLIEIIWTGSTPKVYHRSGMAGDCFFIVFAILRVEAG